MTQIHYTNSTINNINIAHISIGSGDPVLLLHGWGASIELLWPLARALVPYGYCVHLLDLPGFSSSDDPPTAWTVFDYANFVLAYLDHMQLSRVHIFGHSFGGRLCLVLGAEHPERIHKITLSNSAGVPPKRPLLPQLRLRIYKLIRNGLYCTGLATLADSLRDQYNARYGSADFQQVSGIMRQTFINVVNEDLLPYAARVQPSTLLFWGDQDDDTPLWQGRLLEDTIPDAGLVLYEGAGHYAYLERPAETARIMDYFFQQSTNNSD